MDRVATMVCCMEAWWVFALSLVPPGCSAPSKISVCGEVRRISAAFSAISGDLLDLYADVNGSVAILILSRG